MAAPITVLTIISSALTRIGQLGIGQSLSAEMADQALQYVNWILDTWSAQRLMLYTIGSVPYALTPGLQDYSVGPSASGSGSFVQSRPTFVEAARAIIPGTQMENPMNVLDVIKWGAIRDRGAQTSTNGVPSDVYPEYLMPNMAFHVWPIPFSAVIIKLGLWQELQQFATVFDQLSLPPGYQQALMSALAMGLAPYYDQPVSQDLAQQAQSGMATIQRINAQAVGGVIGDNRLLDAPNLDNPGGGPTRGPIGGPQGQPPGTTGQ